MDELAYRLGIDPIELRMRNEPERNPLDGKRFAHRRLREAYALGAERFGWDARTPEPGSMRDGRWLVGMGVASAYHPAWQFPANVTVRLSADGTVLVRCGFHEMGMGAATAQAQVAAHALGVPVDAVRVEYGDTDLPTGPGAGGSAQTASVAASLVRACAKLRREVFALARRSADSPLRGQRLDALEARDGGLFAGRAGETYAAILTRAGRSHVDAAVGSDSRWGQLAGQARFMAKFLRDSRRWVKAASGAQFCEVRVDPDTGEVRVSRWVGAFDIGTVVNAKTAASQLRGGIVMGLGLALGEETLVDPGTGRIINANLAEYHVPVHADVPHDRRDLYGRPGPDDAARRARRGRGGHHRRGRRGGQRGVPRDRAADPRPADHPRQAAVSGSDGASAVWTDEQRSREERTASSAGGKTAGSAGAERTIDTAHPLP